MAPFISAFSIKEVYFLQGGRSWHTKFRQAPICYFRDKCLDFAHNCKFANLIQYKNYLFKDFVREQHLHVLQYLQKQRMVLTTRHNISAVRTLQLILHLCGSFFDACIFLEPLSLTLVLADPSALFQALLWQLRRLILC